MDRAKGSIDIYGINRHSVTSVSHECCNTLFLGAIDGTLKFLFNCRSLPYVCDIRPMYVRDRPKLRGYMYINIHRKG